MNSKKYRITIYILSIVSITGLLIFGSLVLRGEHYYLISLAIVMTALLTGLITFEQGRPSAAYLTGIVIFTAIAVGSRCLFAAFPQVKPIAAVVILAGIAMGAEAGFMTGALAMFLSNFYFLQGAWTPFQMVGMGLVGWLAGIIFYKRSSSANEDDDRQNDNRNTKFRLRKRTVWIALYGFLSVIFIYGLIVDINTVYFSLGDQPTAEGVLTVYLMGLPLDVVLAVTTTVMLLILEPPIMRRWYRIREKYLA